ncbi:MAG: META domain-containing protein [Muribaculaceae bacterium]|nr:META domain-containing protein [Muribaculaceae bacterium]
MRIAEESSGRQQYITFDGSTYFIQTNCNSISGTYNVKGDSITFSDGAMTEKACDNMATEEALRIILPDIVKAIVNNDSVLRLECREPSEYALLYKVAD